MEIKKNKIKEKYKGKLVNSIVLGSLIFLNSNANSELLNLHSYIQDKNTEIVVIKPNLSKNILLESRLTINSKDTSIKKLEESDLLLYEEDKLFDNSKVLNSATTYLTLNHLDNHKIKQQIFSNGLDVRLGETNIISEYEIFGQKFNNTLLISDYSGSDGIKPQKIRTITKYGTEYQVGVLTDNNDVTNLFGRVPFEFNKSGINLKSSLNVEYQPLNQLFRIKNATSLETKNQLGTFNLSGSFEFQDFNLIRDTEVKFEYQSLNSVSVKTSYRNLPWNEWENDLHFEVGYKPKDIYYGLYYNRHLEGNEAKTIGIKIEKKF